LVATVAGSPFGGLALEWQTAVLSG
jgi:hypothetical protein